MATVASFFGFLLYYIYDINSIKWRNSTMTKFFALGSVLLLLSMIILIVTQIKEIEFSILGFLSASFFLVLLIYTLFFAIPFKATYVDDAQNRMAYTDGIYALCRHPGVLWLMGYTMSLLVLIPTFSTLITVCVVNTMNVLYVIIQDLWTFPNTFENYIEYKSKSPFLIPNILSIKLCLSTLQQTPGA